MPEYGNREQPNAEHQRNSRNTKEQQRNTGITAIYQIVRVRISQELDFVAFSSWNLDVVFFQSWNLDVVAFCSLKKRIGITMSWLICLHFSMSWCFSPRISMSWFFGLGISMSWFFGLGISMSWYMCLHGLAFVIIVKTKKSRIIMSIMLLKNISIVQIYATSICIIYV